MLNSIRLVRQQQVCLFPSHSSLPSYRTISSLSFRQAAVTNPTSDHPSSSSSSEEDMEQIQPNKPTEKTGDVMSHSFGEGYSTRADDEGFGGIYGGNDSLPDELPKTVNEGKIHENHPEYDKSQGSEVAEKEKARCQKTAHC